MLNATYVIEPLLICLILFSPLFYAGISILALSFVEGVSLLLLSFLLIDKLSKKEISFIKIPLLPLSVFIAFAIIQICPLPSWLLSGISPATARLYADFSLGNNIMRAISIYPEASINIILQFLSYLAVFWVILNYADTKPKLKRLILAVVVAGLGYSLFGIMRGLNRMTSQFSTFTNPNHFATYIQMIIPIVIGWSLTDVSKSMRVTIIFVATIQILALFLSLSRAGIICFSISFMIMFLLLRLKKPVKKEWFIVVILGLFLSLFLGIVGLRPITTELKTILDHKNFDRLYVLKDSLVIFKDFPLFGVGLGAFGEIFSKYKSFSSQLSYGFTHNESLQILTESGLVGFVSLAAFFFLYLKGVFKAWLKRRNRFALFVGLGMFIGLFAVSLHSLFDFSFHTPANAVLFFVILALLYRVVYSDGAHGPLLMTEYKFSLPAAVRLCLALGVCIGLLLCEILILRRYQAETAFNGVREYKITGKGTEAVIGGKKAIREINKAILLNPINSAYFNKKADLLSDIAVNTELSAELSGLREFAYGNKAELLGYAQADYERAVGLNPAKSDYHLRLGWIYGELGKKILTQQEFKRALMLDTQNNKIKEYIAKYDSPQTLPQ